jgi:mannose-1-phosphate guanylyltransferase
MKAFLLAAGNGTRLRPITDTVPKCLVPIRGTPLLGIWLAWCRQYGIRDVLINTHSHEKAVREYLRQDFGVNITIAHEQELLGSAGTLLANRQFVDCEAEFVVLYADVLTNCDFDAMYAFHAARHSPATLGLYNVSNPNECGIADLGDDGLITRFEEKPVSPKGNLAFAGLFVASAALLEELPPTVPSDIGKDFLPILINRMYGYRISDYLIDIGSPSKYAQAEVEWPGLMTDSYLPESARSG